MKIETLMTRDPLSVDAAEPLGLAAQILVWSGDRELPVLEDGRVVGLLGEREILAAEARLGGAESRGHPVREVMRAPAPTASPDDSVTELAARMALEGLSCVPVVDQGALVGVLRAGDLLAQMVASAMAPPAPPKAPPDLSVGEVMTPAPAVVHPDDYLLDAAARMRELGVRHLPVVDGDGRLLAMLSDRDVRTAVGDPSRALRSVSVKSAIEALRVQDVMSSTPVVSGPGRPLSDAVAALARQSVGALPVVDLDERVIGIVSYVDVLRTLEPGAPPRSS